MGLGVPSVLECGDEGGGGNVVAVIESTWRCEFPNERPAAGEGGMECGKEVGVRGARRPSDLSELYFVSWKIEKRDLKREAGGRVVIIWWWELEFVCWWWETIGEGTERVADVGVFGRPVCIGG